MTAAYDSLTVSAYTALSIEALMPKDKFALGIDYGTESGRVVLIRVRDGEEVAAAVVAYPDGVIDERLPGGPKLEPDWALQYPRDFLLVLE